jgi:hypothetical protein
LLAEHVLVYLPAVGSAAMRTGVLRYVYRKTRSEPAPCPVPNLSPATASTAPGIVPSSPSTGRTTTSARGTRPRATRSMPP